MHLCAGSRLRSWSSQQQAEAFLAATFFALHPIHTEAVAGIVGQAELICAAYSIVAVLLYAEAADLWCAFLCGIAYHAVLRLGQS